MVFCIHHACVYVIMSGCAASPVPYERHADDDLPPIREDREYDSSMEQQSPECDRTMSAEVSVAASRNMIVVYR